MSVRITHYKDIVVHLPPYWTGFRHVPTEVYLDTRNGSTYIICNGSGEDGNCADQWTFAHSVSDHTNLFGQYTGCDGYEEEDYLR